MLGLLTDAWGIFAVAVGIPVALLLLVVVWLRPGHALARTAASVVLIAGIVAATGWVFVSADGDVGAITASPGPGGTAPPPTESPPPGPACTPAGTALRVSAEGIRFDTNCLGAPADTDFTIEFDNRDVGVPHNVAIYGDQTATEALFQGEIFSGPDVRSYQVQALPAGEYFFRCDVHPTTMTGTFVAGGS